MSKSASKTNKTKKPNKSINQKIADLQTMIDWFHSDDFDLDQAAANYQSAADLAKSIEHDLATLKNQINLIDQDFSK